MVLLQQGTARNLLMHLNAISPPLLQSMTKAEWIMTAALPAAFENLLLGIHSGNLLLYRHMHVPGLYHQHIPHKHKHHQRHHQATTIRRGYLLYSSPPSPATSLYTFPVRIPGHRPLHVSLSTNHLMLPFGDH